MPWWEHGLSHDCALILSQMFLHGGRTLTVLWLLLCLATRMQTWACTMHEVLCYTMCTRDGDEFWWFWVRALPKTSYTTSSFYINIKSWAHLKNLHLQEFVIWWKVLQRWVYYSKVPCFHSASESTVLPWLKSLDGNTSILCTAFHKFYLTNTHKNTWR